jgi:hypothetical protein
MTDTAQGYPGELPQQERRSNWQAGTPEGPIGPHCPIDASPNRSQVDDIYTDQRGQLSDRAHNFSTRRVFTK